ncbi:MAG TPA: hypothetical protein VF629_06690 [Hymenobacter sp.]
MGWTAVIAGQLRVVQHRRLVHQVHEAGNGSAAVERGAYSVELAQDELNLVQVERRNLQGAEQARVAARQREAVAQ